MRTLPTGTIISRPRRRLGRLWWVLWHQWGVLWTMWRTAWVGWPDAPGFIQEPTRKGRKKMETVYKKASKPRSK